MKQSNYKDKERKITSFVDEEMGSSNDDDDDDDDDDECIEEDSG